MTDELRSAIEGWAAEARPLVSFSERSRFGECLDRAARLHQFLGSDLGRAEAWKTYRRSAAAAKAILAGRYDQDVHQMVYRAAWGSPIGFAFCDAAWYARELGRFPELLLVTIRGSRDGKHEERIVRDGNDYWQKFAISLNLDGFMKALEDWTLAFGYGLPFHGSEQLRYVLEEVDEPDAKAWLQLCLDEFPSALDGASAIQREMEKIQESERKREERRKAGRKPRPTPAFKEALQWGWLPRSLWGMSTSAIACELDPTIRDEGEATKASGRIRRDITALGYSASHRGEHQEALEREFFQKKDRSDSGL